MTSPIPPALLFGILLAVAPLASAQPSSFSWPSGRPAAIVLTYDDGMDTHLDIAMPDLERRGFRGTFYVQGNTVTNRFADWQAAAKRGHELGNHSLFHPCPKREFAWVRPEYDSDTYTIGRMLDELRAANGLVSMLDGRTKHSLAYMCGAETAGGVSYVDSLRHAGFVTYGRSGYDGRSFAASAAGIDPLRVPSWGVPENSPADSLIAFAEAVAATGGLGVFMFHGVGGQWIQVDREAHDALLAHLEAHPDRFWVAPFSEAMDVVTGAKAGGEAAGGARDEFVVEFTRQFDYSARRLNALAEAMPGSAYAWSPGEGVMSVERVFMHIARYNYYYLASSLSIPAPGGEGEADFEQRTGKETVTRLLAASLEHVRSHVEAMDQASLDRQTTLYGREVGGRAVLLQLLAHMNEHVGQAIAYARMNGIVPPWSR